jgi:hypothetical protein
MTDTESVASSLADFYALSTSASLDYMEYAGIAGMCIIYATENLFQ